MNHFEKYAYRLLLAMTTDEALVVLGLPPNPSAEQVNKAYKVFKAYKARREYKAHRVLLEQTALMAPMVKMCICKKSC